MKIHEILALLPPEARKLYESLRAERKTGDTDATLEGLLIKRNGGIPAVLQALNTSIPIILFSAERQTDSSSYKARLSTEVNVTMPLSSKMMLPLEQITSSERGKTQIVDVAIIKRIAELLLDQAVLNRNELADLRGCLAVWSNVIGKFVVSSAFPDKTWSVEMGKRMSEDELKVCQKVFALISYLCDKN